MSSLDQEKWNARYAKAQRTIPSPPQALIDNICELRPGNLLDVASGEGAVALFMAQNTEFNVTALDISEVGLANLNTFAKVQGVNLHTLCIDLDDSESLAQLMDYDCITIFRYKPSVALVRQLISALTENGRLIISTFNLQHHQQSGFSARFCLNHEALVNIDSRVSLLQLIHSSDPPFTDTYIFQKIPS